jgi:hypothetical protein
MLMGMAALIMLPVKAQARVGLLAQFADDVILENLELGKPYNLRTLGHLPYIVTNAGDKVVDVAVEIKLPGKANLKPGYEALFDPSWVQVVPNKFRLDPQAQGVSEIVITIPNEEAYRNKNYQFDIWAHTLGSQFMAAGAEHRLRMSTGKGPETLAAEKKEKAMLSFDFDIGPANMYLVGVKPGKTFDAKAEKGASLKLTNRGGAAIKLKLVSVPYSSGITPPEGYTASPDPLWLKCKPEMVKVGELSIKEVKLYVTIPDEAKHYGQKYAFLVKAEFQETEVPLEMYSQVLVTVKDR